MPCAVGRVARPDEESTPVATEREHTLWAITSTDGNVAFGGRDTASEQTVSLDSGSSSDNARLRLEVAFGDLGWGEEWDDFATDNGVMQ